MKDIIELCRKSWDSSKKVHQPAYDDLVSVYRWGLTARAKEVLSSGLSGDVNFEAFEKKVEELGQFYAEVPAKVEDDTLTAEPFEIESTVAEPGLPPIFEANKDRGTLVQGNVLQIDKDTEIAAGTGPELPRCCIQDMLHQGSSRSAGSRPPGLCSHSRSTLRIHRQAAFRLAPRSCIERLVHPWQMGPNQFDGCRYRSAEHGALLAN